MTIRPAFPSDSPRLVELAHATGVFKPFELEALGEVLADYHAANRDANHHCHVGERDGETAGFHYVAPAALTERAWDVWWLAVAPSRQGNGVGKLLLDHAESVARSRSARILFIETGSTPLYSPARAFYTKQGYRIAAEVHDFYADGDDKVIFSKRVQDVVG